MAAGLSAGRIGWGLAIRLVRALSGICPLSPITLIENPHHGFKAWLRAVYRLTCPMPLNWGPVVGGEAFVGPLLDLTISDKGGRLGQAAEFHFLRCQVVQRGYLPRPCSASRWTCSDHDTDCDLCVRSLRGILSCRWKLAAGL